MGKYRLAVFDLDGTILDTIEDLADALNKTLTEYGYPEASLQEVRARVGNGLQKLIERSVPEDCPAEEIERIRVRLARIYQENCCNKTRPYPGIPEAFDKLHENGVQVAVVSNKIDSAVRTICETYFPGKIDYCAGERDGITKKPAPDMVYEALRVLQTEKRDVIYIGDSEVDIRTVQNAGLENIIVTWGFRDRDFLVQQGAGRLADSVQEMTEQIIG